MAKANVPLSWFCLLRLFQTCVFCHKIPQFFTYSLTSSHLPLSPPYNNWPSHPYFQPHLLSYSSYNHWPNQHPVTTNLNHTYRHTSQIATQVLRYNGNTPNQYHDPPSTTTWLLTSITLILTDLYQSCNCRFHWELDQHQLKHHAHLQWWDTTTAKCICQLLLTYANDGLLIKVMHQ